MFATTFWIAIFYLKFIFGKDRFNGLNVRLRLSDKLNIDKLRLQILYFLIIKGT